MEEKAYCPECGDELEILKACGAKDYFCNHCRKQISSKKVVHYQKDNGDYNQNNTRKT